MVVTRSWRFPAYRVAMSDDGEAAANDVNELAAPVRQLRGVVAADGDARVAILDAGRATLELANPAQVAMIDSVEVGRAVSPHIRIAFEVTDADNTTRRLAAAGAQVIAAPTQTPWRS